MLRWQRIPGFRGGNADEYLGRYLLQGIIGSFDQGKAIDYVQRFV